MKTPYIEKLMQEVRHEVVIPILLMRIVLKFPRSDAKLNDERSSLTGQVNKQYIQMTNMMIAAVHVGWIHVQSEGFDKDKVEAI